MRGTDKKFPWTPRRILIAIWFVLLAAVLVVFSYPISVGILRIFIVLAIPVIWILAVVLTRRIKSLFFVNLALGILTTTFVLLPGRPVEPERLRASYVAQLKRYEGVPYVWGGENGRGIDCSGLVRRALINAYFHDAITTANSRALRAGLELWWHDCSALALRDQYRSFTAPVCTASSINSITNSLLRPGDLAVTLGGSHVLAYVGDRKWIQAEPGIGKVITLEAPNENGWFNVVVSIMRWSDLKVP